MFQTQSRTISVLHTHKKNIIETIKNNALCRYTFLVIAFFIVFALMIELNIIRLNDQHFIPINNKVLLSKKIAHNKPQEIVTRFVIKQTSDTQITEGMRRKMDMEMWRYGYYTFAKETLVTEKDMQIYYQSYLLVHETWREYEDKLFRLSQLLRYPAKLRDITLGTINDLGNCFLNVVDQFIVDPYFISPKFINAALQLSKVTDAGKLNETKAMFNFVFELINIDNGKKRKDNSFSLNPFAKSIRNALATIYGTHLTCYTEPGVGYPLSNVLMDMIFLLNKLYTIIGVERRDRNLPYDFLYSTRAHNLIEILQRKREFVGSRARKILDIGALNIQNKVDMDELNMISKLATRISYKIIGLDLLVSFKNITTYSHVVAVMTDTDSNWYVIDNADTIPLSDPVVKYHTDGVYVDLMTFNATISIVKDRWRRLEVQSVFVSHIVFTQI